MTTRCDCQPLSTQALRAVLLLCGLTGYAWVGAETSAVPPPDGDFAVAEQPETVAAESRDDTIVIRADRAWEGVDEDVLHLEGNFGMRTSDWEVTADEAEVYGPIEDPTHIVIRGTPAHVTAQKARGGEPVKGEGKTIEYYHQTELLRITGDAVLTDEDIAMRSSFIEYDMFNKRLKSSGSDGVEFVLQRSLIDASSEAQSGLQNEREGEL